MEIEELTDEQINEKACAYCNSVLCSICNDKICKVNKLSALCKCKEWRDRRIGYYCGYKDAYENFKKEKEND